MAGIGGDEPDVDENEDEVDEDDEDDISVAPFRAWVHAYECRVRMMDIPPHQQKKCLYRNCDRLKDCIEHSMTCTIPDPNLCPFVYCFKGLYDSAIAHWENCKSKITCDWCGPALAEWNQWLKNLKK